MGRIFTLCFSICMMRGHPLMPHQAREAQPEPSVLAAAAESSFLKRLKDPNSFFKTSARELLVSLPTFTAGARFRQKRPCRTFAK